jgi:hypothetical protein
VLTGSGAVALLQSGVVNFWPLAAAALGLGALGDRLLAFRPAFIRIDRDTVTIRSHLGFTDRRKVSELITLEWHTKSWRDAIVFNFVEATDNVTVSSAGYTKEDMAELAGVLNRTFLVDPVPNQEMPPGPYDDPSNLDA